MLRTPAKDSAAKAMQAAIDGGFNIVEFTLTTPGCLDLVADFRKKVIMLYKIAVLKSARCRAPCRLVSLSDDDFATCSTTARS